MDELKPYLQYKESEVSWFEKIPDGWSVMRNKYFLTEFIVPSENGEEELLTVSQYTGITRRKDKVIDETELLTTAKSLKGYKTVEKDSMVMNIMLAWNGSLGISDYDGIVSPSYAVFRVNGKYAHPRYLHYLHRTKLYTSIFETASTGVIKSRLRLYPENYLALPSVLPPLNEQIQISRYLDWKTSHINKFIKAKKRLIELLKEQKQVIINDAVTGKIDVRTGKPYPKYKDSGIEWLGQVPEEWENKRLKYLVKSVTDQTFIKSNDEAYVALENVESWTGKINLNSNEMPFESQVKKFQPDDILFGKLRPYLAKVSKPNFKGVCVGEFLVLRKHYENILISFIEKKLRSFSMINVINNSTFGAKMPRADWSFIGCMQFSFPKSLIEQEYIIGFIDRNSTIIERIINSFSQDILLLQEYSTCLIADVVTGKVDVMDFVVPERFEQFEEVELSYFDEAPEGTVEEVEKTEENGDE